MNFSFYSFLRLTYLTFDVPTFKKDVNLYFCLSRTCLFLFTVFLLATKSVATDNFVGTRYLIIGDSGDAKCHK